MFIMWFSYQIIRDEIQTENRIKITFYNRSNQTIERKKAEARAERELAARKREDAKRAKDEVKYNTFDKI